MTLLDIKNQLLIQGTDDGVAKVDITFYTLKQQLDWFEVRELYCNLNEWLLENAHLAGERK